MRTHEYTAPLANQSPPLSREYSMLQTHSPSTDENSIGVKIEYVNHTLNGSPERYANMSPKYDTNLMHDVKQEYDNRVKDHVKSEPATSQLYVTLPPFLNWTKERNLFIIIIIKKQNDQVKFLIFISSKRTHTHRDALWISCHKYD